MTPKGLLEEIKQLPVEQRIELILEAWDSIESTTADVPVPDSHRRTLDRRLDHPSPEASLTWDEVRARLPDGD